MKNSIEKYLGRTYNDLLVVKQLENGPHGKARFLLRCVCGKEYPRCIKAFGRFTCPCRRRKRK